MTDKTFFFISKEMMKDHLEILESLKQDVAVWTDSDVNQFNVGKEDFQQIMSEWQQHLGLLQVSKFNFKKNDISRKKFFLLIFVLFLNF